jgi:hypothetical protein
MVLYHTSKLLLAYSRIVILQSHLGTKVKELFDLDQLYSVQFGGLLRHIKG